MRRDMAKNKSTVVATGLLRTKGRHVTGVFRQRVVGTLRVLDINRGISSRVARGGDMAMRLSIRLGWLMGV